MFTSNLRKSWRKRAWDDQQRVNHPQKNGHAAFTLAEVMIAVGVMSVVLISVFAGILYGNTEIKLSRENLRATQIVLERMEGIRLYTFDQLVSSNMFPTAFTAQYYPLASGSQAPGATYYGNLTITDPATGTAYNSDIRLVTVSVTWTNQYGSRSIVRTRSMKTLVARNGIQSYSFFN